MNADEYQELASRTLIDAPDFYISPDEIMFVWNAIGLAGEAGEVADLAKKNVFHRHELDMARLEKELGDCLWYIAAICTKFDLRMSEIMALNIEKLKIRYPNGYNSTDSIARIDTSQNR
jgi:NTP pyrophosphatase (non-canonical NTP hydrolase)